MPAAIERIKTGGTTDISPTLGRLDPQLQPITVDKSTSSGSQACSPRYLQLQCVKNDLVLGQSGTSCGVEVELAEVNLMADLYHRDYLVLEGKLMATASISNVESDFASQ